MKKQYMDFVPAKTAPAKALNSRRTSTTKATKSVTPARATATKAKAPARAVASTRAVTPAPARAAATAKSVKTTTKASGKVAFATEKEMILGKVEDLNTHFVKSDVPKRPLSERSHFTTKPAGIAAVKAEKVGARKTSKLVEKPVEKPKKTSDKSLYKTPTPFINQSKVVKRPLSKNVYQKKVVAPKEEQKGPVTIISKPEKQAHVGLIVTIILTIILGAAAGTVAFLLLPK